MPTKEEIERQTRKREARKRQKQRRKERKAEEEASRQLTEASQQLVNQDVFQILITSREALEKQRQVRKEREPSRVQAQWLAQDGEKYRLEAMEDHRRMWMRNGCVKRFFQRQVALAGQYETESEGGNEEEAEAEEERKEGKMKLLRSKWERQRFKWEMEAEADKRGYLKAMVLNRGRKEGLDRPLRKWSMEELQKRQARQYMQQCSPRATEQVITLPKFQDEQWQNLHEKDEREWKRIQWQREKGRRVRRKSEKGRRRREHFTNAVAIHNLRLVAA
eukprot:GHVU01206088.1.p1 GENE.GHVU01206088.1~~GHVU01206088.1.p1  ORF type:complete len:277 (-),score=63.45 GHVU01206088.1:478-1308(-)